MLPQRHRLRSSRDFSAVMRRGRGQSRVQRAATPLLVIHRSGGQQSAAVPLDTPTRVGFVVSKGVDRRAVVRNRVTRRLRAIMSERVQSQEGGTDLVIRANPAAARATSAELAAAVDQGLARLEETRSR